MRRMYSLLTVLMLTLALLMVSGNINVEAAERSEQDFIGAAFEGIVVNCNEWITLRYAPSADSASLARIPLGTIVTVMDGNIAVIDGFYPVIYRGIKGYCMRQYLKYYSGGGAPMKYSRY